MKIKGIILQFAKPRICFVAPTIWPVLAGDHGSDMVGGAEVQQAILARSMAAAGYNVSVICMDHGQPDATVIDGITVYRSHTPLGGIPVLRFLYPRLSSIWSAMRRANADIYYQRSSGMLTGVVAEFCRAYGRKFLYAAASDRDFLPDLPGIRYQRDKWLFRRGIGRADAVVVQSERQLQACAAMFGRIPDLIASCHMPPPPAPAAVHGYVLWVGSIKALKRPELFLALARRMPHLRFRMVGGGRGSAVYSAIEREAASLPNVEFVGFVPYDRVQAEFDGARVFVNTSEWEGFPNTFLQAWARGIPTVSFFDTGSKYHERRVVRVVSDSEQMSAEVDRLMTDDVTWRASGADSLGCYDTRHTPEAAVAAYGQVFSRMLT